MSCSPRIFGGTWMGLWSEIKCEGGTWHVITHFGWSDANLTTDIDTKTPCCNQGTQSNARAGFKPRDAYTCSPSTPAGQGGTETNSGTAAAVSNTTSGGGSGPAGGSPAPASVVHLAQSVAGLGGAPPRVANPTGNTAYVPTVPFRQFALPDYVNASPTPPAVQGQCNSALNPTAYQVNHNVATVTRLNMCTGQPIDVVNVTTNPLEIAVTPDGKWGIVTSFYNVISFIDTDTDTVANVIQTDQNTFPFGIAISPDGSYALVTNFNSQEDAILVIDIASQTIMGSIPLQTAYPQSVAISPDGALAWVTFPFSNMVEVIDIMTGLEVTSVSVQEPLDVAFNKTGTVAFIASGQGSVMAVNTSAYSVLANIPTASGTTDLLLNPEGTFLTANNYFASSISVIDTSALTNVSTTSVGAAPFGAALVPIQ